MNFSKLNILAIIMLLAACAPVGDKFCIGNGYTKGSAQYEQCTMRYQASRDLYEYCSEKKGLVQEGTQINQCVEDARKIKDNYTQDASACSRDAEKKFGQFFSQPKMEIQPTLQPDGVLTIGEVTVGGSYTTSEMNSYTAPFTEQCLQIYGWNNAGWQGGKSNPNIGSITSGLSSLNKQPIMTNVPEHPITRLFKFVAEGNAYAMRDVITKEGIPVNYQNYQGYTALHVAAKQGNFQIVQMLIEQLHANTDIRSSQGESVIDMAARSNNPSLVGYITDILRKRDAAEVKREEELRHKKEIDEIKRAIQQKPQVMPR